MYCFCVQRHHYIYVPSSIIDKSECLQFLVQVLVSFGMSSAFTLSIHTNDTVLRYAICRNLPECVNATTSGNTYQEGYCKLDLAYQPCDSSDDNCKVSSLLAGNVVQCHVFTQQTAPHPHTV